MQPPNRFFIIQKVTCRETQDIQTGVYTHINKKYTYL